MKIKKNRWNPSTVDENVANNPDWVKCYTVAIPNLPLFPSKAVMDFVKYVTSLEGCYGMRPEYPHGTLLIYDTENNAKGARNLIRAYKGYGGQVGKNIGEIYIPREYTKGESL